MNKSSIITAGRYFNRSSREAQGRYQEGRSWPVPAREYVLSGTPPARTFAPQSIISEKSSTLTFREPTTIVCAIMVLLVRRMGQCCGATRASPRVAIRQGRGLLISWQRDALLYLHFHPACSYHRVKIQGHFVPKEEAEIILKALFF